MHPAASSNTQLSCNSLVTWSKWFLEKLIIIQAVKISSFFMDTEGTLSCSQDKPRPHFHTLFL
jgi:hypothetical protein